MAVLDFFISYCSKNSFSGDLLLVLGTGLEMVGTALVTGFEGMVGLVLKLFDKIYRADL